MPSRYSCFAKDGKVPKEGHYYAKTRAPLCPGKSTIVPPKKHKREQVKHHP